MGLWAIIPVKVYAETRTVDGGKALEDTLLLLNRVRWITTTVVMTLDPKAGAIARNLGARTISIADVAAWETGLSRALNLAAAAGTARALVLNPKAGPLDYDFLDTLLATEQPSHSLTLVPATEHDDTAMALVSPPDYLRISLGAGSLSSNIERARSVSALLTVCPMSQQTVKMY